MLKSASLVALGIVIGIVFLALSLLFVDVPALLKVLAATDSRWVLVALVSICLYVWIKAMRWRVLLAPVTTVGRRQAIKAVFAGNAVNFLVPHLGDLVRVWMVGVRTQSKGSPLLASVAVERIVDFASICFVGAVILLPQAALSEQLFSALVILAFMTVLPTVLVALFMLRNELVLGALERVLRAVPRRAREFVLRQLHQSLPGFAGMRTPGVLGRAFVLSLLIWLLIGLCAYASMRAVGIQGSLAVTTAVVVLNVVGLILPAAPGHVGTIQLAFVLGAKAFDIPAEPAFGASIIYNFATVLPVMLVGLPCVWQAGFHWVPFLRKERGQSGSFPTGQ